MSQSTFSAASNNENAHTCAVGPGVQPGEFPGVEPGTCVGVGCTCAALGITECCPLGECSIEVAPGGPTCFCDVACSAFEDCCLGASVIGC